MLGFIYSVVAGIFMSIQGVFNTRLSEKMGLWETNTLVQGAGFIITLIIMFFAGEGNIKNITSANKLYLLAAPLGVGITFTVMCGIGKLGPAYATSAILIAQLLFSGLIEAFGLFGTEKTQFGVTKILGFIILIVGILVFKWEK